jgi:hypothetical protein
MTFVEGCAAAYNASGCFLGRWEESRDSKGAPTQGDLDDVFAFEGPIDLEELQRAIVPFVPKKVEEIVDIANANVHDSFGEEKEARALFAKDHADANPFAKYVDQFR